MPSKIRSRVTVLLATAALIVAVVAGASSEPQLAQIHAQIHAQQIHA